MQQRAHERWALFSLVADRHGGLAGLRAEFPQAVPLAPDHAREVLGRSQISTAVQQHAQFGIEAIDVGGAEWETPTCGCVDVAKGQQVTMTFHTSRTVAEMAPYADPRTWPACSAYWVAMTALSMAESKVNTTDWAGAFEEVIEFIPCYPMTTPLLVAYRQDATSVHMTYSLLAETKYLDVDEGSIDITVDPAAPAGMPTKVVAVKTIHWKSPAVQAMPHLAADTYWGELGLNMASRCGL